MVMSNCGWKNGELWCTVTSAFQREIEVGRIQMTKKSSDTFIQVQTNQGKVVLSC